jgi:hypothetical protein
LDAPFTPFLTTLNLAETEFPGYQNVAFADAGCAMDLFNVVLTLVIAVLLLGAFSPIRLFALQRYHVILLLYYLTTPGDARSTAVRWQVVVMCPHGSGLYVGASNDLFASHALGGLIPDYSAVEAGGPP